MLRNIDIIMQFYVQPRDYRNEFHLMFVLRFLAEAGVIIPDLALSGTTTS